MGKPELHRELQALTRDEAAMATELVLISSEDLAVLSDRIRTLHRDYPALQAITDSIKTYGERRNIDLRDRALMLGGALAVGLVLRELIKTDSAEDD